MTSATRKELFNHNKRVLKDSLPESCPCNYCNSLMFKETKNPYSLMSIDHIVPHSKGGGDDLSNLAVCCSNCNVRKGDREKVELFYLKEPMELKEEDYILLNKYIDSFQRINNLNKIRDLLKDEKLNEAKNLIKEYREGSINKAFFSSLEKDLKKEFGQNKTIDAKIYKSCVLIVKKIKAEKDKLLTISEQLNHIEFVIYTRF